MLRYSRTTGGFYHDDVHGSAVPADAVAITAARHARLMAAQATGRVIVANDDGHPVLAAIRPVSLESRRARAIAAIRSESRRRILAVASIERQINDLAELALSGIEREAGGWSPTQVPSGPVERRRRIEAVRIRSNALQDSVATMVTPELDALDPADDAHWVPSPLL